MIGRGDIAPDFTLRSTEGSFTLSERVKNGPVLLYFFPVINGKTCTNYIALLNERYDDLRKMNVELVHINLEPIENHLAWIEHTGSPYEDLSDPDLTVCRAYDALIERAKNEAMIGKTNRALFLIDGSMTVRYAWRAYMPMDTVPVDELIDEISAILRPN